MINRPLDLVGLLALFWDESWAELGPEDPTESDYTKAKGKVCNQMLSADDIDRHLWLLDPVKSRTIASPDTRGTTGLVQSARSSCIPLIRSRNGMASCRRDPLGRSEFVRSESTKKYDLI